MLLTLFLQPLASLRERLLPISSIRIRQSVIESLWLSLLNLMVPWEPRPAEYRPEGSNCQVPVTDYMTAPVFQLNPGVLAILTEDDNEPLSQESGPVGAVHSSKARNN